LKVRIKIEKCNTPREINKIEKKLAEKPKNLPVYQNLAANSELWYLKKLFAF
jgi:hypothetical protein